MSGRKRKRKRKRTVVSNPNEAEYYDDIDVIRKEVTGLKDYVEPEKNGGRYVNLSVTLPVTILEQEKQQERSNINSKQNAECQESIFIQNNVRRIDECGHSSMLDDPNAQTSRTETPSQSHCAESRILSKGTRKIYSRDAWNHRSAQGTAYATMITPRLITPVKVAKPKIEKRIASKRINTAKQGYPALIHNNPQNVKEPSLMFSIISLQKIQTALIPKVLLAKANTYFTKLPNLTDPPKPRSPELLTTPKPLSLLERIANFINPQQGTDSQNQNVSGPSKNLQYDSRILEKDISFLPFSIKESKAKKLSIKRQKEASVVSTDLILSDIAAAAKNRTHSSNMRSNPTSTSQANVQEKTSNKKVSTDTIKFDHKRQLPEPNYTGVKPSGRKFIMRRDSDQSLIQPDLVITQTPTGASINNFRSRIPSQIQTLVIQDRSEEMITNKASYAVLKKSSNMPVPVARPSFQSTPDYDVPPTLPPKMMK